jgi:hypothetical protein
LALNIGVMKVTWGKDRKFRQEMVQDLRTRTYAIAADPQDRYLYVATADGLQVLNPDGEVQQSLWQGQEIFAQDLSQGGGKVIAATREQGILFLKGGQVLRQVRPKWPRGQGDIYAIRMHGQRIYAATSAGFMLMDSSGLVVGQLNKALGFSTNRLFAFELVGDTLWLCHSKGLQRLDANLLGRQVDAPPVRIAAVAVNDSPLVDLEKVGSFDHSHRKFRFELEAPTLRYRDDIKYHYRLVGYEESWSVASYEDHAVTYNALAPGNYTFLVKSENQGEFSPEVAYAFEIGAPFYARWWFVLTAVAAMTMMVRVIYLRQLRIQRRKAQMQNELNVSRLTAIQSQMNQHFIFNSLNSIQDLVLKGDIDNSYRFITKFANLIRRTLNYSEKDFIDFEQEVELLELYLALEKLRFKDELQYTIETEGVEDILVPPMLVQPFIENALLHGLFHKSGPKLLQIRFALGETLLCTVEDNGIGRERAMEIKQRQRGDQESFSGKAIRQRFAVLEQYFGGELGYTYVDLEADGQALGTRVELRIPVKRKF